MHPIFDGHNDVLLRLWRRQREGGDPVAAFMDGAPAGHIDLHRARAGGMAGGLCAIYIPSGDLHFETPGPDGSYETPLAAPLDRAPSLDIALQMASIAVRIARAGGWTLCESTSEIRSAMKDGTFAAVLHLEGCEPIGSDLAALDVLHAAGLRSLGPVWSRNNIFGHGVPFSFPKSPDCGPGLTAAGRDLVRACDRLGILVDLSHITERGFWDVAEISEAPLVASHSNAHALVPVARNLTDRQLDAIRERDGLVGLNFAVTMLRADGREDAATPMSDLVHHVDHMVERMGIGCVAIGSDFDGALVPEEIGDASGLQVLVDALARAGYGSEDLELVCRSNWLRVLGRAWKEA
jgi:membrane dipeptidase